ncbi:DNA repair protein XRCC4-like [Hydractinia symbiolongicarpus]|uniref:DNA repair protein XRCC4-like n=1 Tax=Hydractinia symbiolongicarpus TaxID=13093 RepID=UPI00254CDA81|nr:DNA repair protein XRCC4-like [Hydractinia symbiolongicarpus]
MVERMHKISLNDKSFYLFSNQSVDDNLSSLTITNGDELYLGELSMQDIQEMASEVDMSIEKYQALIKESFGYKSGSHDLGRFAYLLHGDGESYKFIIKQELEGGILFKLGSIVVHKQETSSGKVIEIFDHLQDQLKSLQTEVSNFKSLSKSLEADKKDMCKRLEAYTSIKNSLEQDLYTKFSLVLNEKKARIRELKTQLSRFWITYQNNTT